MELDPIQSTIVAHPITDRALFHAKFWQDKIDWCLAGDVTPDGSWAVRVLGSHFTLHTDHTQLVRPGTHRLLGFGGAYWYIQFIAGPHAGLVRVTNNLWHQGKFPDELKGDLPDNAIFLTKGQFTRLLLDPIVREYFTRDVDTRPSAPPFQSPD